MPTNEREGELENIGMTCPTPRRQARKSNATVVFLLVYHAVQYILKL